MDLALICSALLAHFTHDMSSTRQAGKKRKTSWTAQKAEGGRAQTTNGDTKLTQTKGRYVPLADLSLSLFLPLSPSQDRAPFPSLSPPRPPTQGVCRSTARLHRKKKNRIIHC